MNASTGCGWPTGRFAGTSAARTSCTGPAARNGSGRPPTSMTSSSRRSSCTNANSVSGPWPTLRRRCSGSATPTTSARSSAVAGRNTRDSPKRKARAWAGSRQCTRTTGGASATYTWTPRDGTCRLRSITGCARSRGSSAGRRTRVGRVSTSAASSSATSVRSSTCTNARKPRKPCAKPIVARTGSWRCSRTSCAIRSRRSAPRRESSPARN